MKDHFKRNEKNYAQGAKLRSLSAAMQGDIDHKFANRLENTPKRAREAEGQRTEGRLLQRVQEALRVLAMLWENDNVPLELQDLKTKKSVYELLYYANRNIPKRELLESYMSDTVGIKTDADRIKDLERDLIGRRIDGFFPTPRDVIDVMMLYSGLGRLNVFSDPDVSRQQQSQVRVLEPSAGKGNIADVVRELYPDVVLHCVECVPVLRNILEIKGHTLAHYDILEYVVRDEELYDIIIMNPPFERYQDVEHVRYCFDHLLKPGGRLTSIMGESAFSNSTAQARTFRDWLSQFPHANEKFEAGTFKESNTNVVTRMISITKPDPLRFKGNGVNMMQSKQSTTEG